MGKTTIAWTTYTFNPWWGCTRASTGCDNCYAESWDAKWGGEHWGKGKPRRTFGSKHFAFRPGRNATSSSDCQRNGSKSAAVSALGRVCAFWATAIRYRFLRHVTKVGSGISTSIRSQQLPRHRIG